MLHAKDGTVRLDGVDMEYIRFGTGSKTLVMLPGLGDGLRSMKGTALPFALAYRAYAKEYTVYVFSRKSILPENATTRDMARDQKQAMDALGIARAHIFGVSMGGMIAQHLAADYPETVDKLVLIVTCARENPVLNDAVGQWITCAKMNDHTTLMDSNVRLIYTDRYYRRNKWLIPIMGALTKPKSYDRFLTMANACLTHDAYAQLPRIQSPTLVIGGWKDRCLGGQPSREIADAIAGSELKMYDQYGHGLYEEAPDFNAAVLDFLRK